VHVIVPMFASHKVDEAKAQINEVVISLLSGSNPKDPVLQSVEDSRRVFNVSSPVHWIHRCIHWI